MATVPLIPRKVLFADPAKSSPRLSPDGRRLAYLAPYKRAMNIWVGDLRKQNFRPITRENRSLPLCQWAKDNKHILYIKDKNGDENYNLYSVNAETEETTNLTPFKEVSADIVKLDRHHPHEAIIKLNKEDVKRHDVYLIDIESGDLQLIAKNPGTVIDWIVGPNLTVGAASRTLKNGGKELMLLDDVSGAFNSAVRWGLEDRSSYCEGFNADMQSLYLIDSRSSNTLRLLEMEISSKKTRIMAQDPHYDVDHVVTHPDKYEVQLVYFDKERMEHMVLDKSIRGDASYLSHLEGGDFGIVSRNFDDTLWVVNYSSDKVFAKYYLFDRGKRSARFLFDSMPRLDKYKLAKMAPFSFRSRDRLKVHGYLTRPSARKRSNFPMVVKVHGGPWSRDSWEFDREVQWLANRGYACLQINFRGSVGYGKKFLNAGNREWGRKMHNDLVDAVRWAVRKRIADPNRVAIYGVSYGGYAALVGATFTPGLFSVAVDRFGPVNLVTLLKTTPRYWYPQLQMLFKRVGNPYKEKRFLISRSPISKVDSIKIPILVVQGANDPRVKITEAEQIVSSMKKKGIRYKYLLFKDEGHGLVNTKNRFRFFSVAERFLAENLKGQYER